MIASAQQKDLLTGRYRTVVQPSKEVTDLHIPLVTLLRKVLKPNVLMRHVPNGEHRDPRTAAKLKAMGVLAGSADLEFFWAEAEKRFRALFLELKLPGRNPTAEQAAFGLCMMTMGAQFYVAHSIDEAINIVGERGLIRDGITVGGRKW